MSVKIEKGFPDIQNMDGYFKKYLHFKRSTYEFYQSQNIDEDWKAERTVTFKLDQWQVRV